MLELHRYRHVDWKPSPVVSLATSLDGAVVAAARENGAIEVWIVAAGSVGWHCELTIPGKRDAAISSLVWCISNSKNASTRGRLFSAGLDGFISEWDLATLEAKEVVKSYGGSVWYMASEPLQRLMKDGSSKRTRDALRSSSKSGTDNDESSKSETDGGVVRDVGEQRVVVACDDGCVRLYAVQDDKEGMIYKHSFPRVKGRVLSVVWSADAAKIFSGGSDGCIRCWDVARIQEVYRITAGLGGIGSGSDLCVWSLLTLRDGTVVSGDSSGSTQFWDGKQGTLLQAHTCHGADVLSLAASPSHRSVFAAGADGQVIQYQLVPESSRLIDGVNTSGKDMVAAFGDKWVFVGTKRAHTHDVRALAVAVPIDEGESVDKPTGKKRKRTKNSRMEKNTWKWAHPGVPMLVSGGNDAKLFTYPADAFLAFHPHDVCFAPQHTVVKLTHDQKSSNHVIMMAQHHHWLDVWRIPIDKSDSSQAQLGKGILKATNLGSKPLNKRKIPLSSCNGGVMHETQITQADLPNGSGKRNSLVACKPKQMGKVKGSPPELLVRIKCKSVDHVCCSALSGSGQLVAFSDRLKPRLFEIMQQDICDASSQRSWVVRRRRLPGNLPPAHCMAFSADSTRFLLACPQNAVFIVDVESAQVLHTFETNARHSEHVAKFSPLTRMCTSADGQWLATSNILGDITIFNLETFGQHWSVPRLQGSPVTALLFHSRNSSVLIVGTSANQLHVLDVEARQYGEWSRQNSSRLPQRFLEFPGGIQGLSMPPSKKSTSIIAYSQRAMCLIDFQKPVLQEGGRESSPGLDRLPSSTGSKLQNGGSDLAEKNFVVVPFKEPVLFLEHLSDTSLLLVEKPWLDVLHELPPPVYRHLYGT